MFCFFNNPTEPLTAEVLNAAPQSVWEKAAEFGVLAFLLVLVLVAVGYALWKLGTRLTEATADSLRRQAEAGERTADAVTKIGDLTAAIHIQNQQCSLALGELSGQIRTTARAMSHIVDAVHELTPEQETRVKQYLLRARELLLE